MCQSLPRRWEQVQKNQKARPWANIWLGCLPTYPRDKDLRQLFPSLPRVGNGNSAEMFKFYNDKQCWKEADREQHGIKKVVRLLKNCPWQLHPLNPELGGSCMASKRGTKKNIIENQFNKAVLVTCSKTLVIETREEDVFTTGRRHPYCLPAPVPNLLPKSFP